MTRKVVNSNKVWLFFKLLKERGGLRTFQYSLQYILSYCVDNLFDMKYRIDTYASVEKDDFENVGVNKEHASMYSSINTVPLRKLLKTLRIPTGGVLVDLGCGKGKVLLIASEFGFKEARGVDFSPLLCEIARTNCSTYKARTKTKTDFAVYKCDVLDYRMKDDEDVFYLYNPFDAYILKQVIQNILKSLQRRRRKIWIIYGNPVHSKIVEENMSPATLSHFTFWRFDFVVYVVDQSLAPDLLSAEFQNSR